MATEEKLKTYTDEEVEAKIAEHGLDGWYLEDGWLRRKYNTDGWPSTLMLVNAVGYLCEAAYHHADLSVTWGKLWVKLTTHSARRHHRQGLRPRAPDRGHGAVAPGRRQPARGHAEQVRLQQGHAVATPARVSERLLFVTGKLAAPALRDTLGRADLPFDYDVAVMKITVAALMTTDWIAEPPRGPGGVTRIMIPGMCEGDVDVSASASGSRPRRAPPTSRRCRPGSARRTRARATASATSACSPRSTTSRAWTATRSSRSPSTTATPAPT